MWSPAVRTETALVIPPLDASKTKSPSLLHLRRPMRCVSIAIAALLSATASAQPPCDLESLVPLLVDERNDACEAASGVSFPPHKDPHWEQTCGEVCTAYYADLLAATPTDCVLGAHGVIAVHADIVNQHRGACGYPLVD